MQRKVMYTALLIAALVVLALPAISPEARGSQTVQTIKIVTSADTHISEEYSTRNYGGEYYLIVGAYQFKKYRTLLYFDLSSIPRGSTIVGAELHLTFSDYFPGGPLSEVRIRVYSLDKSFEENCATWERSDCTSYWSKDGGDYTKITIDSVLVKGAFECDDVSFDVKTFVDLVVNGGMENHGLLLAADDSSYNAFFYSREFGNAGTCYPMYVDEGRPYLVVRYLPPVTSPSPTPSQTPSPPSPFDFSIGVSPSSATATPGTTITFLVTVDLLSGSPEPVYLSIAGLPSDCAWVFDPPEVIPPGTSTLSIMAGERPETYTFVVVGTDGGITKTAEVTLTVSGGGRCVIATATYGGELSDEVQILRRFRDDVVVKSFLGKGFMRAFNRFYYSWSTWVAQKIEKYWLLKEYMKFSLYPLIYILRACQEAFKPIISYNSEIGVLLMGLAASMALGGVYLAPTLYVSTLIGKFRISRRTLKWGILGIIFSLDFVSVSYLSGSITAVMFSTSLLVISSLVLGGIFAVLIVKALKRP